MEKEIVFVPSLGECEKVLINRYELIFCLKDHRYFVNGREVFSVTNLIKRVTGDLYRFVPKLVLENARLRGISLHQEIEEYESLNIDTCSNTLLLYKNIKRIFNIKYIDGERYVIIFYKNTPIAAGRFDVLAEVDGDFSLIEIKATSRLYIKNVTLQLNLYRIGFEACYNKKIKNLGCIRIYNNKAEYKKIDIIDDEKLMLLFERITDV